MTLDQFQELSQWHLRHQHDHPLEGHAWTMVLTLWLAGWVGAPAAWLLAGKAEAMAAAALVLLPRIYLGWRERLHRRGRLRCDWIVVMR
jgi:hypothetical protein